MVTAPTHITNLQHLASYVLAHSRLPPLPSNLDNIADTDAYLKGIRQKRKTLEREAEEKARIAVPCL